jgi:hypothetical protein
MRISEIINVAEQFQPQLAINLKEGISDIVFWLDAL